MSGANVFAAGKSGVFNSTRRLLAVFSLTLFLGIASASCGGGAGGPLEMVPDDADRVRIFHIDQLWQDGPDYLRDIIEDEYEDTLEDVGVSLNDVSQMVLVEGGDGGLLILEGQLDFDRIRDDLDDADYDDDEYQGYETWEDTSRNIEWVALIANDRQVMMGDEDAVRGALSVLERGSGSLLDDSDNDLTRALARAEGGWGVVSQESCRLGSVSGCRAMAYSISQGEEEYLLEFRFVLLFRNERSAESALDDVEDELEDDLPRRMDIEDVRLDGEFIIVTIFADEDDVASGQFGF